MTTLADMDLDMDLELSEPEPAKLVQAQPQVVSAAQDAQARLQALEDALLAKHLGVLMDVAKAREVTLDDMRWSTEHDGAPPPSWVAELGEQEATRAFRVASSAWLNTREAPAFLALSAKVAIGISRARAAREADRKEINIGTVNFVLPPPRPQCDAPIDARPVLDVSEYDG